MAQTFGVTAVADKVALDAQRKGLASFTVSNTSDQPVRGRGQVVAVAPADASWFTVVGNASRPVAPGATEQYPVQLAVPPTAAPGSYSFRLDAVNEADPDEDTTAGPTVSFEVPAAAAAAKKFPWWIVAVVAAVLIGAVVVVLLISGGDDEPIPTTSSGTTGSAPPRAGPIRIQDFEGVWKNPDSSSLGFDAMEISVSGDVATVAPVTAKCGVAATKAPGLASQVFRRCDWAKAGGSLSGDVLSTDAQSRIVGPFVDGTFHLPLRLELLGDSRNRMRVTEGAGSADVDTRFPGLEQQRKGFGFGGGESYTLELAGRPH
jgi:hypothetical protein